MREPMSRAQIDLSSPVFWFRFVLRERERVLEIATTKIHSNRNHLSPRSISRYFCRRKKGEKIRLWPEDRRHDLLIQGWIKEIGYSYSFFSLSLSRAYLPSRILAITLLFAQLPTQKLLLNDSRAKCTAYLYRRYLLDPVFNSLPSSPGNCHPGEIVRMH